jgi:hypothetical protein
MKVHAFVLSEPGRFHYEDRGAPELRDGHALLQVRSVGLCGTDLSSFRGSNPLVSYPRVPGHEIAATVVQVSCDPPPGIEPGANVAIEIRGRDGATTRIIVLSREQALDTWKAKLGGRERLILSQADLFFDGDRMHLRASDPALLNAAFALKFKQAFIALREFIGGGLDTGVKAAQLC